MDNLLKYLSAETLLMLAPVILIKIGGRLKKMDKDNIGRDDALANIFIAAAPAVSAFEDGDESGVKKAVRAIRDTCNGYLGE